MQTFEDLVEAGVENDDIPHLARLMTEWLIANRDATAEEAKAGFRKIMREMVSLQETALLEGLKQGMAAIKGKGRKRV